MDDPIRERLQRLEELAMHRERLLDQLNEVVCSQADRIDTLEEKMERLRKQVLMLSPSVTRSPDEEEPPPHY